MKPEITIRSETDADIDLITKVTIAAFKTLEISNHTEQFINTVLRATNDLSVSLVAEADGQQDGASVSPYRASDPREYNFVMRNKSGMILDCWII
ncbi:MAG: hypothetical protein MZU91_07230 [Desulfosudis oleivorans]|nr:hypothetical protein [Desulfosudis oleivorans]